MVRKPEGKKGVRSSRSFAVVVALSVLGLAVIGAVVALLAENTQDTATQQSGNAPQVRQLDRESLRSGVRNPGPCGIGQLQNPEVRQ